MLSGKTLFIGAVVLGTLLLASPAYANISEGGGIVPSILFGVPISASATITFGVVDIDYRGWLPPAWAWTQLAIGGGLNMLAASLTLYWTEGEGYYLAIPELLFGTWFVIHGILSLKYYRAPDRMQSPPALEMGRCRERCEHEYWKCARPCGKPSCQARCDRTRRLCETRCTAPPRASHGGQSGWRYMPGIAITSVRGGATGTLCWAF